MSQQPTKPVYIAIIDDVIFGLYQYTKRDDHKKITDIGYAVIPMAEVNNGGMGFSDPELNARIGFSQPREDEVAVASGADMSGPFNDDMRERAIQIASRLEELLMEKGGTMELSRVAPDRLAPSEYECSQSTTVYAHAPIAASAALKSRIIHQLQDLERTWQQIPMTEMEAPAEAGKAVSFAQRIVTPELALLDQVGEILMKHFPADDQEKARNAATGELVRLMITKKGPQQGD